MRIAVIVGDAADPATVRTTVEAPRAAGHDVLHDARPTLAPAGRRVRYFHPSGARAASALADDPNAALRALPDYAPRPVGGYVEFALGASD